MYLRYIETIIANKFSSRHQTYIVSTSRSRVQGRRTFVDSRRTRCLGFLTRLEIVSRRVAPLPRCDPANSALFIPVDKSLSLASSGTAPSHGSIVLEFDLVPTSDEGGWMAEHAGRSRVQRANRRGSASPLFERSTRRIFFYVTCAMCFTRVLLLV